MTKKIKLYLFFFGISCALINPMRINAQSEFSSEIFLKKNLEIKKIKENQDINVGARWRSLWLNPQVNRLELSGEYTLQSKSWVWTGGLRNFYSIQKSTFNNFELRPFIGGSFRIPITNRFDYIQYLRLEMRNQFFSNSNLNNTALRSRIRVGIDYDFNINKNLSFKDARLVFDYELFSSNNNNIERFKDTEQFRISLIKKLAEGNTIAIRYFTRTAFDLDLNRSSRGHFVRIDYVFHKKKKTIEEINLN